MMFLRAASCKKSTRKNKLIRKNKSTRTEILYLKISVLVDLFFLINLFFLVDFLHEAALNIVLDAKISGSGNNNSEKKIVEIAGFFSIILKKVELIISCTPNVCRETSFWP